MNSLMDRSLAQLITPEETPCPACGRPHRSGLAFVRVGSGVIRELPAALAAIGCRRPFVVCDVHTRHAALAPVQAALEAAGIPFTAFTFPTEHVEPDETAMGSLCMAFDPTCDGVLAVGSGVVNDCCKVLAHVAGVPSAVVATAPSMDGYASNSSSMIRDRVKVSLYNACPGAIIADTDILCAAPQRMLWAGLGDMLAKFIALCEWRISHLVTGEYYCPQVAGLMRRSLAQVVDAAPRLMTRDPQAIAAITEGLILSGVAMAFAGVSRPASGLEHYYSHLWEMFALERGLPMELHGIQVGVGTVQCLRLYDRLRRETPDAAKALQAMQAFDPQAWEANVRRVFGRAAPTLLQSEATLWHKNDPALHAQRLQRIVAHWEEIVAIIAEELPQTEVIVTLMRGLGMPVEPADIGQTPQDTRDAFLCSRDIRDKYLTSSLLWDLGLLEAYAPRL